MPTPKPNEKNIFFDINKLPPEKGLLLFGMSMNKLTNRQNAQNCLNDIKCISPAKISQPLVGLNFIYSDFLYFNSEGFAYDLKNSFMEQMNNHKKSMQNILEKNRLDFQIQHAFNYLTWGQLYLGTENFEHRFKEIKKIYESDPLFQKYVNEDCVAFNREATKYQIDFFLEESLMYCLLAHNEVRLPNDFIENQQKWILNCYPGKAPKCVIYFNQLNPFKLDWPENPYQNAFYDLEGKQLIKYEDVDLETYSVK
jgi:hypothetical protein